MSWEIVNDSLPAQRETFTRWGKSRPDSWPVGERVAVDVEQRAFFGLLKRTETHTGTVDRLQYSSSSSSVRVKWDHGATTWVMLWDLPCLTCQLR